ncbi:MAG: vWA domain-containing protein [Myxococcota bacterium]
MSAPATQRRLLSASVTLILAVSCDCATDPAGACDSPALTVLVDASGSQLLAVPAGITRWTTLRGALFGAAGRCAEAERDGSQLLCGATVDACELLGRAGMTDASCDAVCGSVGLACASARTFEGVMSARRCTPELGTPAACDAAGGVRRCRCTGATGRANDGALRRWEDRAELALATYTTSDFEDRLTCLGPAEGTLEPRLGAGDALASFLDARHPSGGTPTAEALEEVLPALEARAAAGQRAALVVLTDGAPAGCGLDGTAETEARIALGLERGVRTYVMGLGADEALVPILQRLAAAGGGGDLQLRVSSDEEALRAHLDAVLAREAACP